MLGHIPIPGHITAIYIFAVVNLMALFHITLVEANIIILDRLNKTIEELPDREAQFGPAFPDEGLWGHIALSSPANACSSIVPPPSDNASGINWIALIRRHECNFDIKVLNAQKVGYAAALIFNVGSDELVPMGPGKHGDEIHIPSAFIGARDGNFLWENFDQKTDFFIVIDNSIFFDANMYLIPFAIVVGICFVLMLTFMMVKWIRDTRKKRRSRLSKEKLKKIPIKKFKKGDHYDVCAICLDEYEEGEKLRVLPCAHAYHMKCVDPWLTKNKRTCPVCKRKVIPGDHEDSESESESDDDGDQRSSESTPLLTAQTAGQVPRFIEAHENPGMNRTSDSDSEASVGGAVGGTPTNQSQSLADVHPTPSPRAQKNYGSGAVNAITVAHEVKDNVSINSFYSDDETALPGTSYTEVSVEGAAGGVTSDDTVDFTDNFYSEQEMKPVVDEGSVAKEKAPRRKKPLKVKIRAKNGSKRGQNEGEEEA